MIKAEVQHLVCNENTLCYLRNGDTRYGVLSGSVIRGGRNPFDGMFIAAPTDVFRKATADDFKAYLVMVPPDLAG